jgi:hypothetical protein
LAKWSPHFFAQGADLRVGAFLADLAGLGLVLVSGAVVEAAGQVSFGHGWFNLSGLLSRRPNPTIATRRNPSTVMGVGQRVRWTGGADEGMTSATDVLVHSYMQRGK